MSTERIREMQASIEAAEDLAERAIDLNGRLLAERNAAQASEASLRKRWADLGTLYADERARRQEAEQELARLRRGDRDPRDVSAGEDVVLVELAEHVAHRCTECNRPAPRCPGESPVAALGGAVVQCERSEGHEGHCRNDRWYWETASISDAATATEREPDGRSIETCGGSCGGITMHVEAIRCLGCGAHRYPWGGAPTSIVDGGTDVEIEQALGRGAYHDGLSRKIECEVSQRGECSPSDVAVAIGEDIKRVSQNMFRMQARGQLLRVSRGRYAPAQPKGGPTDG